MTSVEIVDIIKYFTVIICTFNFITLLRKRPLRWICLLSMNWLIICKQRWSELPAFGTLEGLHAQQTGDLSYYCLYRSLLQYFSLSFSLSLSFIFFVLWFSPSSFCFSLVSSRLIFSPSLYLWHKLAFMPAYSRTHTCTHTCSHSQARDTLLVEAVARTLKGPPDFLPSFIAFFFIFFLLNPNTFFSSKNTVLPLLWVSFCIFPFPPQTS